MTWTLATLNHADRARAVILHWRRLIDAPAPGRRRSPDRGPVSPPSRREIWAGLDRDEKRLVWRVVQTSLLFLALILAAGALAP